MNEIRTVGELIRRLTEAADGDMNARITCTGLGNTWLENVARLPSGTVALELM